MFRVILPTRELAGTGVKTSAIGFGCAGLFQIPERNVRRLALDAAYDAGIRHFDVAPMYGLGLAEAELAPFLSRRRADVTITTKFGIKPTVMGKAIARVQRPVRAFLAKRPAVAEELKVAGQGPRSGAVGRLIYASPGYHRQSAQQSLERSLRVLDTDYIDVFLLHDPTGSVITEAPSLVEYLEEQRRLGRIRCWGVTGPLAELPEVMRILDKAAVAQFKDDIFAPSLTDRQLSDRAVITYGALAQSIPLTRRFLAESPEASKIWSERLGMDLADAASLPKMLLGAALRRNLAGPVLFSSTRPERAQAAVEAAILSTGISDPELAKISEFAVAVLARAEISGTA
jgi:D-threo-aldose 1-dehydrogenase